MGSPFLRPSRPVGEVKHLPICIRALIAAFFAVFAQNGWSQEALPAGFTRLRDVAPSIRQDIRYAGPFNFTGRMVPGYEHPQCIARELAAKALARAQARLLASGFELKVYDCYRPLRAVRAFVAWSKSPGGDTMKSIFYPALDKSRLFALGYIALHSRHSIGTAIDVGLVRAGEAQISPPYKAGPCDGAFQQRVKESSLDLGTTFDCFSDRSATASPNISAAAQANRTTLRRALEAEGFHNYSREWWHYEFNDRSATMSYDFPVQ
jgi:zinc D-Ala-D-Ala dipeptidase